MNQRLVDIVSAMAIHHAIQIGRGSDWVASMVDEAWRIGDSITPGQELTSALNMLRREQEAERKAGRKE